MRKKRKKKMAKKIERSQEINASAKKGRSKDSSVVPDAPVEEESVM